MGYSRQGVAIGLSLLGLVALDKKSVMKFLIWIALAATFHKSAVILLPLAVLGGTRHRLLMKFWVSATMALLFILLLQEHVDGLLLNYIEAQYGSSGAAIRITMNALPAALFVLVRRHFQLSIPHAHFGPGWPGGRLHLCCCWSFHLPLPQWIAWHCIGYRYNYSFGRVYLMRWGTPAQQMQGWFMR